MPKIIVTSRYLKSGSGKNLSNYVKYIATREGSVAVKENNTTAPATQKQQNLILSLLKEFPESAETFEYDDYKNNSTQKNASRFISEMLERNADRIANRENYVGYLANRPGAVKFGSHGLFSQEDTPIDLERVAKEIANHKGNVWTHVVSLRRDDAQKMGYDNLNAWRELVKRQIPNIAQAQKIDMKNLKWYAAFHDKKNNPHVHIIVYSTDVREGFLTNNGIEKIRSSFANDIYTDELHHLHAQQTDVRNLLKKESAALMHTLAENLKQDPYADKELCDMTIHLHEQLTSAKGKKVYGYLKPEVKDTVDKIFEKLADNESVKKMYSLWCEMDQLKHDIYSSAKIDHAPLTDNEQFRSVKNMIIKTVLDMGRIDTTVNSIPEPDTEKEIEDASSSDDISGDETDEKIIIDDPASTIHIEWSDEYKNACKLFYKKAPTDDEKKEALQLLKSESDKGNVLAMHELGKLYSSEDFGFMDSERSHDYYERALHGFIQIEPKAEKLRPYVQYRIGKIYSYGSGTDNDYEKSFEWFKKAAQAGNKFAQYSLANQYYYGNGIEKDLSSAHEWYTKSASQGMPYANYALAQMYSKGEEAEQNDETARRYYARALRGFLAIEENDQADENLMYKIGRMYKYGLGTDSDMLKAIDYFRTAAEKGNPNAKREMASELISGEHIPQNTDEGIRLLTEFADMGDTSAAYKLGKIYLNGENVFRDLDTAEKYLKIAVADNNEYALYSLAKLYLTETKKDIDKAVDLLERCCNKHSDIFPYAAYSLAKILLQNNQYHDVSRTVDLLRESADDNNWSAYLLGRLYLFGNGEIKQNKYEAVYWLTKSANDGNEFAETLLRNNEQYESAMLTDTIFGLFVNLSRCIEDNYMREHRKMQSAADRKLRRMIAKKKEELGIKDGYSQQQSY